MAGITWPVIHQSNRWRGAGCSRHCCSIQAATCSGGASPRKSGVHVADAGYEELQEAQAAALARGRYPGRKAGAAEVGATISFIVVVLPPQPRDGAKGARAGIGRPCGAAGVGRPWVQGELGRPTPFYLAGSRSCSKAAIRSPSSVAEVGLRSNMKVASGATPPTASVAPSPA